MIFYPVPAHGHKMNANTSQPKTKKESAMKFGAIFFALFALAAGVWYFW